MSTIEKHILILCSFSMILGSMAQMIVAYSVEKFNTPRELVNFEAMFFMAIIMLVLGIVSITISMGTETK